MAPAEEETSLGNTSHGTKQILSTYFLEAPRLVV